MKKIKFLSLFLFPLPLHHLHCKYGAPKQAKHEQINVHVFLGLFQNKILFQNKCLFLFCPPLKYFSLPVHILLSEQIVRKQIFIFIFFPPSSEDLSKF
jgi:hypothetical protein